jgi:uncharacterized membrane protein
MFDFLWNNTLGQILMTVLVSMVPVIELRGAIPMAVSAGLPYYVAIPLAVIGNLIPVPFIIFYIKRIFAWIRKKMPKLNRMVDKLENRARSKSETVQKSAFWGLFIFVAIPLPGTGAWTGSLLSSLTGIRLWKALLSIVLGVIGAGVIMTLVSYGTVAAFQSWF